MINLTSDYKFKSKKRPVSAVADNVEIRNVNKVIVKTNKSIALPAELQGHCNVFYNIFNTNQHFFLLCLYEKKLSMHY